VIIKLQIFARLSAVNLLYSVKIVYFCWHFTNKICGKHYLQNLLFDRFDYLEYYIASEIDITSFLHVWSTNQWYKVFGKNYLVHLRPFGRSCKAMKHIMNKQLARRVTIHEKQTSTTMIAQILTTLTTSV